MDISKYRQERHMKLPIYGAAADIESGTLMKKGTTPGTNNGALIAVTGNNEALDIVGVLGEKLDYSEDTETLINGTTYVEKSVEIIAGHRVITIEYSQATADLITCTQAVTTTALTLGSLEDDIDAAFLYVVAGTGIGQLQYLTASAAGSATLKAAFTVSLDTTSKIIKILPRFHTLMSFTTDGIKLSSQAGAGNVESMIVLNSRMIKNDDDKALNPTVHPGQVGLQNSRGGVRFVADIMLRTTQSYSLA